MRTTVWVFIGFPFPLFNKNTLLTEALGFSKILLVMFFVFVFSTPSPATHSPFVLFSSFTHFSFPHYLCSPQFSHILHSPCFPLPLSHTHTHSSFPCCQSCQFLCHIMFTRQGVHERSITEHNKLDNSLWGGHRERQCSSTIRHLALSSPSFICSVLQQSQRRGGRNAFVLFILECA